MATSVCSPSPNVGQSTPPAPMCLVTGVTHRVCASGCDYTLPGAAVRAAQANDTIEIEAGSYADCISIRRPGITLRGLGAVKIKPNKCGTVISTSYPGTIIEDLEVSSFRSGDGLGIGFASTEGSGNGILRRVYIHDGDYGISASGSTLLVEDSRFDRVGFTKEGGHASSVIQTGTDLAQLIVRRTRITNTVNGGSSIKSFAQELTLECNVIAELEGDDSYAVDMALGRKATLKNNVIEQGPRGPKNNAILSYASNSFAAADKHALVLAGNVIINDYPPGGDHLQFVKGIPPTISVMGNQFVGTGSAAAVLRFAIASDGNTTYSTRKAAGIAAYPALPILEACVGDQATRPDGGSPTLDAESDTHLQDPCR